ncbi:malonyl CoA-acyl carrier protein transacylase [Spirochaetia bacterium]|nr:malonyl CoA-acyl carrier protein transacylase [Spirochaetia bacterium]
MKKNSVVYLFPGQGAQYTGMALDFLAVDTGVKKLFETASEICGKDMRSLLESDAETLKRTDISQPAVTLANLAAAAALATQGFSPIACAGFSLGEYAALVCAGVISAEDCFRLVKARGEAMQKSADRLREAGDAAPGMAAVIGLPPEQVEALIAEWSAAGLKDLYAANINSPKQLVVSGTAAALAEAETRFKEAGARRVLRLQVAGPFHSPLIADAAEAFRPALETVEFREPKFPLFSNVTGRQVASGAEAKKLALAQITSPVRWVDEQAAIAADIKGIDACLEVGPGKVLQGLWSDSSQLRSAQLRSEQPGNDSEIPCYAAGTVEDIAKIGNNA